MVLNIRYLKYHTNCKVSKIYDTEYNGTKICDTKYMVLKYMIQNIVLEIWCYIHMILGMYGTIYSVPYI